MSSDLEHALATLRALPKARAPARGAARQPDVPARGLAARRAATTRSCSCSPAAATCCGRVALEALAQRDGDEGPLLLLGADASRAQTAVFLLRALDRRVRDGLVERAAGRRRPGLAARRRSRICARWSGAAARSCWLGHVPDERLDTVAELVAPARRRAAELRRRVARAARRAARDRRRPERRSGASGAATTRSQQADALRLDEPLEREVEALAPRASPRDKPVLVVGERGSGRTEPAARARARGSRATAG